MKKTAPPTPANSHPSPRTAIAAARPQQTDRQRRDELARLLPLWPAEIDNLSLDGRRRIVAALERGLRAERRRGKSGHWAYDLARHAALVKNWKNECAALKAADMQQALNAHSAQQEAGPFEIKSAFVIFLTGT
jgi:hypothetical protein